LTKDVQGKTLHGLLEERNRQSKQDEETSGLNGEEVGDGRSFTTKYILNPVSIPPCDKQLRSQAQTLLVSGVGGDWEQIVSAINILRAPRSEGPSQSEGGLGTNVLKAVAGHCRSERLALSNTAVKALTEFADEQQRSDESASPTQTKAAWLEAKVIRDVLVATNAATKGLAVAALQSIMQILGTDPSVVELCDAIDPAEKPERFVLSAGLEALATLAPRLSKGSEAYSKVQVVCNKIVKSPRWGFFASKAWSVKQSLGSLDLTAGLTQ